MSSSAYNRSLSRIERLLASGVIVVLRSLPREHCLTLSGSTAEWHMFPNVYSRRQPMAKRPYGDQWRSRERSSFDQQLRRKGAFRKSEKEADNALVRHGCSGFMEFCASARRRSSPASSHARSLSRRQRLRSARIPRSAYRPARDPGSMRQAGKVASPTTASVCRGRTKRPPPHNPPP